VVAGLLGVGGWYYWTGTAAYSLQRLHQAIQQQDRYLFEKHVDLAHLTCRLVDDFLAVDVEQELQQQTLGPLEQVAASLGMTFVQLIKPRFIEEVQDGIVQGVESGSIRQGQIARETPPSQEQFADLMSEFWKDLPRLSPRELQGIHTTDHTATIELGVELNDGWAAGGVATETLTIRFIRTPDRYWRATEVMNFKELVRRWDARRARRLELANQPIRQQLREAITVLRIVKEQGLNGVGTANDAWLVVTFKNETASDILGLVAALTVTDRQGRTLFTTRVQDLSPIPAGAHPTRRSGPSGWTYRSRSIDGSTTRRPRMCSSPLRCSA
jgi:hypothetical protein